MSASTQKAWEPNGGYDAFFDRCLEKRGKGRTWRGIARDEAISHVTLYEWFKKYPEFQPAVKKIERGLQKDNIRQTLLEIAIDKKNVTALIYLAKAMCKMWDQPPREGQQQPPLPDPTNLHPGMTPDQAKEILKARLSLVPEKP